MKIIISYSNGYQYFFVRKHRKASGHFVKYKLEHLWSISIPFRLCGYTHASYPGALVCTRGTAREGKKWKSRPHHEIDQINPRGPRKGHASHRTIHSAWVRGRLNSFSERSYNNIVNFYRLNSRMFKYILKVSAYCQHSDQYSFTT
jgi:hypothetical protein